MKKIYNQYALYNRWANAQLIKVIKKMSIEEVEQELGGSFPTLHTLVYHIWMAEEVWLQRLQLAEQVVLPNAETPFHEMLMSWQESSTNLLHFVQQIFNDEGIEHLVQYKNLNKEIIKTSVGDCLHQVFNHGSFHRGQAINFCRMLGYSKLPKTDFIAFVNGK